MTRADGLRPRRTEAQQAGKELLAPGLVAVERRGAVEGHIGEVDDVVIGRGRDSGPGPGRPRPSEQEDERRKACGEGMDGAIHAVLLR